MNSECTRLTVSLPHDPARPCRPTSGFGLVMMMMVIGDTCGWRGIYEIHICRSTHYYTPRPLLPLQNQKNVEIRIEEINIARIKNPVSCLIAGLS